MLKSLPPVVRIPLRLLASAGFATVTILLCVLVLAWSTFLVGRYGLSATFYGVYGSWWFALLLLLLGITVVAAAVVKIPWRRSQTGFLVVHAGIIVLLIGCWLTWKQGIEGQLGVAEGATSSTVTENTQHFNIQIVDVTGEKDEQTVRIPFRSGPFNWGDYSRLSWFPWHWAHRDRGVLYDHDGVKLEVLDYMADSEMVPVPELVLRTQPAGTSMAGMMGGADEEGSSELTLSVRSMSGHGMMGGTPITIGSQHQLPTGELVTFRLVETEAAVRSFLEDRPEAPWGPLGQIVFRVVSGSDDLNRASGVFRFSLAEMIEKGTVAIGDTSLRVQVTQFTPARMQARLAIYDKEKPAVRPRIVSLNAFQPALNMQDPTGEVIGSFWFPAVDSDSQGASKVTGEADKNTQADEFFKTVQEIAQDHPEVIVSEELSPPLVEQLLVIADLPRVDLIQGPGIETQKNEEATLKLYVREWDGQKVTAAGSFDPKARKIEWFTGMGNRRPIQVKVVRFTPAPSPDEVVRPVPFEKKASRTQQRAQVRLTVGEKSDTFWLGDLSSDVPSQLSKSLVEGDRSVTVELRRDEVELGFGVHLDDFTVQYSPGSAMPLCYSSQVDFVKPASKSERESEQDSKEEAKPEAECYQEDVTIEVNYPAQFKDPSNGRLYRFFQTSYHGPIRPGEPAFEQFVGWKQKRDTLYFSYFTVTYDPGRFWKYAGCFMIILGIAIMYYMKAYFFRRFSSKMKETEVDANVV